MTEPPADAQPGTGPPARIRPFLDAMPDLAPTGWPTSPTGLRPFVLTSGRVQGSDPEIGMETQVSARRHGPMPQLPAESQAIVALCAEPLSVAEISAQLRLHLGVVRILVGDLRLAGYLDVHAMDVTHSHDPETILRVMRGLRAIP